MECDRICVLKLTFVGEQTQIPLDFAQGGLLGFPAIPGAQRRGTWGTRFRGTRHRVEAAE
jgi:hypothetical protein